MFLKNRSFNVKMVKDSEMAAGYEPPSMSLSGSTPGVTFSMNPEQLAAVGTEFIENNTQTIVNGIVTVLVVKTACDLVRILARRL